MPYTATVWQDNVTLGNQTRMNNLEQQFLQALTSINKDIIGAGFVLSGYTAAKDGSIANQLDVAAGRAYLVQTGSNNDLGLIALGSTTQTTSTINTTYNLYLQPNGTWYWSTSNAPAANSLYICTVATDGGGNITTVTDKRTLNVILLPGAAGLVGVNRLLSTQTANAYLQEVDTGTDVFDNLQAPDNGSRKRHHRANAGSNVQNDYLVGNTDGSATFPGKVAGVAGQATAGSFGVAPMMSQAVRAAVTVTTLQNILTVAAPADGFYRLSGHFSTNNSAASENIIFRVDYTDATSGTVQSAWFVSAQDPSASTSAPAFVAGNVGIGSNNNLAHAMNSFTINAKNGTNIIVKYQDPAGVPNDLVTVFIERLA